MAETTSPEWMVPWLTTPFYPNRCDTHTKKYLTVYCGACMGKPWCESCWDSHHSDRHHNHRPILHVRKASRRVAIRVRLIGKYWDVSGVQTYIINSREILYLNPNPKPPKQTAGGKSPKCETCERKLIDSHYSFCSIACKHYRTNGGMQRQGGVERAIERKEVIVAKMASPSKSKSSRKGTPTRAPFF